MESTHIKVILSADSSFDIPRKLEFDDLTKKFTRIIEAVPLTATVVIHKPINTASDKIEANTYESKRFVIPIIPNEHTVAEDGYECWTYQHKQTVELPLNALSEAIVPDAGITQYTFTLNLFIDRDTGKGLVRGGVPERPIRTDLPPKRIYYYPQAHGRHTLKNDQYNTAGYTEYPITMHTRVEYIEVMLTIA